MMKRSNSTEQSPFPGVPFRESSRRVVVEPFPGIPARSPFSSPVASRRLPPAPFPGVPLRNSPGGNASPETPMLLKQMREARKEQSGGDVRNESAVGKDEIAVGVVGAAQHDGSNSESAGLDAVSGTISSKESDIVQNDNNNVVDEVSEENSEDIVIIDESSHFTNNVDNNNKTTTTTNNSSNNNNNNNDKKLSEEHPLPDVSTQQSSSPPSDLGHIPITIPDDIFEDDDDEGESRNDDDDDDDNAGGDDDDDDSYVVPEAKVRWYWFTGTGWKKYQVARSVVIEKHFEGGTLNELCFSKYRLDIRNRNHITVPGGEVFQMVRASWFWDNDAGVLIPYFEDIAQVLEEHYRARKYKTHIPLSAGKWAVFDDELSLRQEDSLGVIRRIVRGFVEEGGADEDNESAPRTATVSAGPPREVQAGEAIAGPCVVCMAQARDCLFRPCAHIVTCLNDAKQLFRLRQGCPICRSPIEKLEKVFLV